MKTLKFILGSGFILLALLFVQCDDEIIFPERSSQNQVMEKKTTIKAPDGETAGNNLSFPVLWADDFEKPLPGTMGEYSLNGVWWYVWGEDPLDPNYPVYSCQPNPSNPEVCLDGTTPGDGSSTVYKAYVQKDVNNVWQAFNATPTGPPVFVDEVDWGDDLESVDWTINSQVRCEVVLFEYLDDETYNKPYPEHPQFPMRHVYGWGSNEVHGVQAFKDISDPTPAFEFVDGDLATVYSHNARFTIQKINATDLGQLEGNVEWNEVTKSWEGIAGAEDLINDPLFNMAVYQAGDGPGFYNAEINVKGKIIYGYTWKVRNLNEGDGYYRLTFSFDNDGQVPLNTFFDSNTKILVAEEVVEEKADVLAEAEEGDRGGVGVMDVDNNLTYMDILITPKTKGGGKGSGGSGSGGSGGGNDGNGFPGGGKGRN